MWFHTLDMTRKGFAGVVFDGTDRIQHMFMRYEYPDHPSNRDKDTVAHRDTIEHLYERSDEVVGRTMKYVNDKTVLIVISDHGFTHFSWGVNLNSWLLREGYLFLKEGCTRSGEWFENIDWTRTKVFQLGLTGIFINRKGREGAGIVAPGEELESLKKELVEKLTGLVDERNGQIAIHRIFDTSKFYDGPFLDDAPDFIIGYEKGYRASWEAAVGIVDDDVFVDNTKSWSGDHCLDFEKVPGIFFSNRKIEFDDPHIMDIGPTVLRLFGVPLPRHMTGKALFDGMPPAPAAPAKKEERKEVSVPAS
jgi:predicted AlkP superfamily phosphohydrolase/phosphomutase